MLKAAYLNEAEKLVLHKKYLVFLLLDVGFCLFYVLSRVLAGHFADSTFGGVDLFGDVMVGGLSVYLLFFLPLIALLGASDLFSSEYHDLSLRMLFLRPVERWKLFFAKTAAVFSLCFIFLAVHFTALLLLKLIFSHSLQGVLFAAEAYFLDLFPLLVVVLFFGFFQQLVRSSGSAVALSAVVYVIIVCIGRYVSLAGGLVFTEFLSWHSLWIGSTLPMGALMPKIGILLGTGIIFYCAGLELFDRKEI
ncbi:MAG: ABC transporter permease [Bacillota bacterium]|jgi:ABC-2 type transport system permease protein